VEKTIITLLFLLAFAPYLIWFETTSREAAAQRPQAGDPNLIDAGKRHSPTRTPNLRALASARPP